MLHGTLLLLALGLVSLGSLTVVRSPDWNDWRLAMLAGEFGHWLALGGLFVAAVAWTTRGAEGGVALVAGVVALGATGLLLVPVVQAARVAGELKTKLDVLGAPAVKRAPLSAAGFFGRAPEPARVTTHEFAPGLWLDFYAAAEDGPAPCIVMVHGGGWDGGSRDQLPGFNHWLASRGYAVAAVSYRLAPAHRWPAQREDVRAAVAFLKAHHAELGIDPRRFVLMGRSAGGQIAQTVGYTAGDAAIRGVVGLYAPADLHLGYSSGREDDVLASRNLLRQFLGGSPETARAAYDDASAVPHVRADSPPTLLIHGRQDTLVWYRHSERLAARLTEAGVPHAVLWLPWATHAFEFNLAGPGGQLTTYALERFLALVTR